MIGFSPRRSLTAHHDWKEVLETLRAKFHTYVPPLPFPINIPLPLLPFFCILTPIRVKLPKSFVAINLSEKVPGAFGLKSQDDAAKGVDADRQSQSGIGAQSLPPSVAVTPLPSPLEGISRELQ